MLIQNKFNLYIVGGGSYCFTPFSHTCNHVSHMKDADVIVFTGGADIHPQWYGCKMHERTHPHIERDIREIEEYKESLTYPRIKLRIGICRGDQLLAALSGAKLIQDVTHHCTPHRMINKFGEEYRTLSIHHQMVYPFEMPEDEYDILYWSSPSGSNHYLGDKIDPEKVIVEPEVIYFPKTRSLGIQGHPEMMDKNDLTVIMLNKLLIKYCNENNQ
jgi:gamma-glutamyl-gamma-aminobutyrate hydrolase PuuD